MKKIAPIMALILALAVTVSAKDYKAKSKNGEVKVKEKVQVSVMEPQVEVDVTSIEDNRAKYARAIAAKEAAEAEILALDAELMLINQVVDGVELAVPVAEEIVE